MSYFSIESCIFQGRRKRGTSGTLLLLNGDRSLGFHLASVDTKGTRFFITAEWKWEFQLITRPPLIPLWLEGLWYPLCYYSLHGPSWHFGGEKWEDMMLLPLNNHESLTSLADLLWYHPIKRREGWLVTERWDWKSKPSEWPPLILSLMGTSLLTKVDESLDLYHAISDAISARGLVNLIIGWQANPIRALLLWVELGSCFMCMYVWQEETS